LPNDNVKLLLFVGKLCVQFPLINNALKFTFPKHKIQYISVHPLPVTVTAPFPYLPLKFHLPQSVALPGFGVRRCIDIRENNLTVTQQKYYEIHAINSDKAIGHYLLSE